jgi:hypothetical protein
MCVACLHAWPAAGQQAGAGQIGVKGSVTVTFELIR